jgi:hypothetical protein
MDQPASPPPMVCVSFFIESYSALELKQKGKKQKQKAFSRKGAKTQRKNKKTEGIHGQV